LQATITRKIGYVLSRAAFQDFKKRVDYSEYGGRCCWACAACASSATAARTPTAIKNAIRWRRVRRPPD